jgi:hypothetical protein
MEWDMQALMDRCPARVRTKVQEYLSTLVWKEHLVAFHARYAREGEDTLNNVAVSSEAMDDAWDTVEAHTIAAAYTLHSMGDVIAQVINVVVFDGCLAEDKVSINKMRKQFKGGKLQSRQQCVLDAINGLLDSNEFRYIGAFVNIIKHRRLIYSNFVGEFRKDEANEQGLCFIGFEYKKDSYTPLWASEIYTEYATYIVGKICAIGNALNSFVGQSRP